MKGEAHMYREVEASEGGAKIRKVGGLLKVSLGRLQATDERDRAYPVARLMAEAPTVDEQRRKAGPLSHKAWTDWMLRLRQEGPTCVGATCAHIVENAGVTYPESARGTSVVDYTEIYRRAQQLDEWPGENYEGTSMRGGAKALAEMGFVSSYYWAEALPEITDSLLYHGPGAMGSDWFASMFNPVLRADATGTKRWFIDVDPASGVAGGHEYTITAVNISAKCVRILNSWGEEWGERGHAWMSFEDLELLMDREGDYCVLSELDGTPG